MRSSRAGLALLLAFLHAVGRPRRVMRSKDAVGFIPGCKLQLPLMPRHLHQPRLLHQRRQTVRATVRAVCRQNVYTKALLHAHSADKCTTERWAHDATQTTRLAPHALRAQKLMAQKIRFHCIVRLVRYLLNKQGAREVLAAHPVHKRAGQACALLAALLTRHAVLLRLHGALSCHRPFASSTIVNAQLEHTFSCLQHPTFDRIGKTT